MTGRRKFRRWATILLALAGTVSAALAQEQGASLGVAERQAINPGLPAVPVTVTRATPAAAWRSLLAACGEQRWTAAAHLLDLTDITLDDQLVLGRELAEKLCRMLAKGVVKPLPMAAIAEEGGGAAERDVVVAARLVHRRMSGEVWLRRTRDMASGEVAWLITRRTVSDLPLWYAVMVEGRDAAGPGRLNVGLGEPPAGLHRGNPRDAVNSFLALARRGDFAGAAHLLDLSEVPKEEQPRFGELAARRLMLLLVRHGWVRPARLSNDPAGAPEQGVAEDREVVGVINQRGGEVKLTLQRRLDPELGVLWTFSAEAVAEIGELYRQWGYGVIGDHLPVVFFAITFAGLQLWQWVALLLILGVGWFVGRWVGHLGVQLLRSAARRTETGWDDLAVHSLDGPLGVVVWGVWLFFWGGWVGLDPSSDRTSRIIVRLVVAVGLVWLLLRVVDAFSSHLRRTATAANGLALSFLPVMTKILKVFAVVVGVLAGLDIVGINVMALLAGLGLGGLALAFAAQKTIENLFGAVAIAGDRPFKIGDFVSIGDITGTVEDVGLRSTRLRTLARTLVTIPNGVVAGERVTNFTARDRMLYNPTIGLVYGTTVDQLVFVIDEIRKLLLTHPRVYQDAQRVRFKAFGAYSLDIEVVAWFMTQDVGEFTALAEELNFAVARIVEASGSSFAFPSQTLYLGSDSGLDAGRAAEIAREVASRRETGRLAVPEPSPELRAALQRQPAVDGEGI